MGCCSSNNEQVRTLEKEIANLKNEKKDLNEKLNTSNSTTIINENEPSSDVVQLISSEQNEVSQVLHILINYLGNAGQMIHEIGVNSKIKDLEKQQGVEKIKKYINVRKEETSLELRLCENVKQAAERLEQLDNEKRTDINSKINELESLVPENSDSKPLLDAIKKKSEEYGGKKDLNIVNVATRLLNTLHLEHEILVLKNNLPKNYDEVEGEAVKNLKQIQEELLQALNESYLNLKKISLDHGSPDDNAKINSMKNLTAPEFFSDSILSIANSLSNGFKNLISIEKEKTRILQANTVENEINQIDEKMSKHLEQSNSAKEKTLSSLQRHLGGTEKVDVEKITDLSKLFSSAAKGNFQSSLFGALGNLNQKSLLKTTRSLRSKIEKIISHSEQQDKALFNLAEQVAGVQNHLDDLEIQLDEFLKQEMRELTRTVSSNDQESRDLLDKLKSVIFERNSQAETAMNIVDHLGVIFNKFKGSHKIEETREKIREYNKDEINRVKSEMQDKINQLEDRKSLLETENERIEAQIKILQASIQADAEIVNNLSQSSSSKEMEMSNLKNQVTSLTEEISNLKEEQDKAQDEISDLRKENRTLKKSIREKENEIRELNEKIGAD